MSIEGKGRRRRIMNRAKVIAFYCGITHYDFRAATELLCDRLLGDGWLRPCVVRLLDRMVEAERRWWSERGGAH
jgi:hypothetical protein